MDINPAHGAVTWDCVEKVRGWDLERKQGVLTGGEERMHFKEDSSDLRPLCRNTDRPQSQI